MIENTQSDWFGNGGDTIGSIFKMTPTQLASWNSTVTNENEIAQREYLSHFKTSLVDIPADTLRNFNDSHYLMELKKQAVIEVEQGSYFFSTKMNFDTDDHKNILIVLPLCDFHSQTQKEKSRVPTTAPTSVNENVSVLEDPTTEAIQKQKTNLKVTTRMAAGTSATPKSPYQAMETETHSLSHESRHSPSTTTASLKPMIDEFLADENRKMNQAYPSPSEEMEDSVDETYTHTSLPLLLDSRSMLLRSSDVAEQYTGPAKIVDATKTSSASVKYVFDSEKLIRLDGTIAELIEEIKVTLNLQSVGNIVLMMEGAAEDLCESQNVGHYFVSYPSYSRPIRIEHLLTNYNLPSSLSIGSMRARNSSNVV